MNKQKWTMLFPHFVPVAGILGALARRALYLSADGRTGLLPYGHAAQLILSLISLLAIAIIVLSCIPLKQANKYLFNFPASPIGAVGFGAAAAGMLVTGIGELILGGDGLATACALLSLPTAGILGFLAHCRFRGQKPSVIFGLGLCIYFMVFLVCRYRVWSANPQLEDYVFPLLASVCLLLASYQTAAFAVDSGSRRLYTAWRLAAGYFCLVSLPNCPSPVFYAAMAIWMFCNPCDHRPMPRKGRNVR